MKHSKMVVIILGPPGSGKGTQSELISNTFNLYSFETSKFLERAFNASDDFVEVNGEKFFIKDEKRLWETGSLCSPPFVTQITMKSIKELYEQGKNIIFSGSPRTIYEAEKVIPLLKELYGAENIKIIFLDVSPEETIYRNSRRRLCTLMRHSILYSEENKALNYCPIDGSKLVKREGLDTLETIKVRIEEFKERTLPLLSFFEKEGFVVNKLNGAKTPAEVFEEILKVLQ